MFVMVVAAASASAGNGTVTVRADTGAEVSVAGAWTYTGVPEITGLSPVSGQQGTVVNVTGVNLLGGGSSIVAATLGGVAAASVEAYSDTLVVLVAGSSNASTSGPATLVADTGATVVSGAPWTYVAPASIDAASPASGLLGTLVTISGTGLLGGGAEAVSVAVGGVEVESIVSSTNSEVVVKIGPSAAGVSAVTVVADTGAWVSQDALFEVLAPGAVVSVEPSFGQRGTFVVIRGEALLADGTNITRVLLDGVAADVVSANASYVAVVANDAPAGVGDVVLVADTEGRVEGTDAWEYRARGQISSITPTSGHEGTEVLILGQNLFGHGSSIGSVRLGGVPATVLDSNNFFARVVAGPGAGSVGGDVEIVADTGAEVVGGSLWTYVAQAVITAVSPSSGQAGTFVTLRGENLLAGAAEVAEVRLAGIAASVVSFNATQIVVRASQPQRVPSSGTVSVTASTGATYSLSLSTAWTYVDAADINAVVPSQGSFGTVVTLFGANLLGGSSSLSSVELAGVQAAIVSASNDKVVVVAQASNATGLEDVVLTASTGAVVVQYDAWRYVERGQITGVTPGP